MMLSTLSFPWNNVGAGCDHKPGVYRGLNMGTVADRLAFVAKTCRATSKTAFARWIKSSPQKVDNWRKRDSLPRDAAILISRASGASLDWLLTGSGEPFPNGATPCAPPSTDDLADQVATLQDSAADLLAALVRVVRVVSARVPGAAAEISAEIRSIRPPSGARSPLLEVLGEAAAATPRAAEPAGRSGGRKESGGSPRRKDR